MCQPQAQGALHPLSFLGPPLWGCVCACLVVFNVVLLPEAWALRPFRPAALCTLQRN